MKVLHKAKQLLQSFVLPSRRFKESHFLPEKKPKSFFEFFRAPKLVRRVALGLALVSVSSFTALQVSASQDPGAGSIVDNYFQVNTSGTAGQGAVGPSSQYPNLSSNATWEIWLSPRSFDSGGVGKNYLSKEDSFTFGIMSGTYHWAMRSDSNWVGWINTQVRADLNAWAHVAWVKSGTTIQRP